ncbi:MAG: hypothetical protein R6W76_20030, partial [Caldilinea sp.]
RRNRPVEIATAADIDVLQRQVDDWSHRIPSERLIVVDASTGGAFSQQVIDKLLATIQARLGGDLTEC